ncbi:MAG: hypothetical protein AB8H86_08730 [Polyangiales bacterium]
MANGRGSVLVGFTPGQQRDAWYVGAERTPAGWRLTKPAGAANLELLRDAFSPAAP